MGEILFQKKVDQFFCPGRGEFLQVDLFWLGNMLIPFPVEGIGSSGVPSDIDLGMQCDAWQYQGEQEKKNPEWTHGQEFFQCLVVITVNKKPAAISKIRI